jgi:hypothetical protein
VARDVSALYAFRGNGTREFWKYGPIATFYPNYVLPGGSELKPAQGLTTARKNQFALSIAPNPFTSSLNPSIAYSLPRPGNVSLKLYDVSGRLVSTLASGYHAAGAYSSRLAANSERLAAGIYIIKYETGECRTTEKLVIE